MTFEFQFHGEQAVGNILEFVTGASEEPPLGVTKTPQIQFPVAEVKEPLTTDEVINKY